jgi:hypothetical protein
MSETVYAGQSTIQASLFQSVSNTANVQIFSTPGQWIKPAFGTSVMIECWGAGGGGGGAALTPNYSGTGGGGGSYASNTFPINFFNAPVAYVFVGVGGAGGTVPTGAGGLGGQSNVSLTNDSSVAFIRAYGGEGGSSNTAVQGGIGAGMLGPRTFGSSPAAPLNNIGTAVGNNIFCGGGGGAGENGFPSPANPGGPAIFGGAGGMSGARAPTLGPGPAYLNPPSIYGGIGGLGGLFDQPGQTGGVRGGGGGGGGSPPTGAGANPNAIGGQGGRGEVRIFVF